MQLRLQTKIVVLITCVAVGVGLISSLLAGSLLQRAFARQIEQQAALIANSLSKPIALAGGDLDRLRAELRDAAQRIDLVDFACMIGADGRVIAHSFGDGECPARGRQPRNLKSGAAAALRRYQSEEGPILVYECPLAGPGAPNEGGADGGIGPAGVTLSIGMDESAAFGEVQVVCNTIIGVSLGVAALGALMGFFLSRKAILPLGRLAWAMRSFGAGVREHKLAAFGGGVEADELARAFNRMIENRKRTEEELARAQALLLAAIEQTPAGIVIADAPDVRIRMANSAALGIRGESKMPLTDIPIELHPKSWLIYRPDGTPFKPEELPLSQAILHGRTIKNAEVIIRRQSGENRWVLVNAAPVRNAAGEIIAGVAVFPDVTDIRRAAADRKRLRRRMQEARRLESLAVLAGGVAHDFNNLLVGVLGNADLALLETGAESPAHELLGDIKKAAARAAELASQMLAYSGKARFAARPIDLNALVLEIAHLMEASIPKSIELRFELAENPPVVSGDAAQIKQIAMNLVLNASEAIGRAPGTITIKTSTAALGSERPDGAYLPDVAAEGLYACLEVSDTGCGMDAETQRKMFDPFFSTKFTGRGLGLAALIGIVRGHRGTVQVASKPGEGTAIRILLPRCAATGEPAPLPAPSAAAEAWRRDATVLIVDDDRSVRDVAGAMLRRHGLSILTASHGNEGLDLFRRRAGEIDLVLLDLTMPHNGGAEMFREIRRIRGDVKVILWSGYNGRETAQALAADGLAAFIQKPFDRRELLAKVRCVLDVQINR